MLRFILHRLLVMVPTLIVVSVLIFIVINLPPGDYLSNQIAELRATGQEAGLAKAEFLRHEYALDRPLAEQYLVWIGVWPGIGAAERAYMVEVFRRMVREMAKA